MEEKNKEKERKGKKNYCGICQKNLTGNFRAHLRTHDNDRPFLCGFCKWSFKQNIHLKRHVETVHKGGKMIPTTRDQFECAECNKCYTSFQKLISHDVLVHQKSQFLTCQICGRRHVDLEGLMRHYKFAHSHAVSLKDDKFYVCTKEDCSSAFSSLPELEKHLLLHNKKEEESVHLCSRKSKLSDDKKEEVPKKMKVIVSDIACLYCPKRFFDVENLILHTVSIHLVSGETCIKCGKVYAKKSGARKHLRFLQCPVFRRELESAGVKISDLIPTLGKSTCDICNVSFSSATALDIHMRKHNGDKPHLCEHCGKGFTQKGNLKTHIETIHEGKKVLKKNPFQKKLHGCNECVKSFTSAVDLRAHMRTHSGDKPFKCEHCGREFSQKGNLNMHIRRWHTDPSNKTKRLPAAKTQPFPSDENIDLNHFIVNQIKAEDPQQSQLPHYMFTKFKTTDLAPSTETLILPSMMSSSVPNLNFTTSGEKPVLRYFQHFSAIPSTSILPSAFLTDSILNDQIEQDQLDTNYITQGDDSVIVREKSVVACEEDFMCQEANVICCVSSSTDDVDFTITNSSLVDETPGNPLNVLSSVDKKEKEGRYGHCYEEMTVIEDSNDTFKMNDGNRSTLDQVISIHDTFNYKADDFMDSLNQTFDAPENNRKVFAKKSEVKGNTLGRKKIDVVSELPTSFETDYDPFEGNSINRDRYSEETNSLNCHEVNVISYLNASFQPDNETIELSDIKSAEDESSGSPMETNVIMAAASAQFENSISLSTTSNYNDAVNSAKCLETNVITGLNQDQSEIALTDGSSSDVVMNKDERASTFCMATNVIKAHIKPDEARLDDQISANSEVPLGNNVNKSRQSSKEFLDELIVSSIGQTFDMKAFSKESANGDAMIRNNSFSCKETNVIKGILSTFETPSFTEDDNENVRIGCGTLHDHEHTSSITPITQCSTNNQHLETNEVYFATNVISTVPPKFGTSDASSQEKYSQEKENANPSPKCLETNVIRALDLPTASKVSEANSIICKETNVIAFPPFQTRRSFLNRSQTSLSEEDKSTNRNICLVTNVITGVSEQLQTTSASGLLYTQNNCRQTNVIIDSTTVDKDARDIGLCENVVSSCIAQPTNVITSANSQSSTSFADCIGPMVIHSFDSLTSGFVNYENPTSTSFETTPSFESLEKELDADESISTEPVFYLLEQTKDFESTNFNNYCPSVFSATPTTSTRTQVIVNSNIANEELFMSSNFFLEDSNELKTDNDSDGCMTLDDDTDYEEMAWSQTYNMPLLTSNVGAQTVYASSTVIKNITGGEVKDAGLQHTSSDDT